jgi:hypothetical protein
MLEKLRSFDVDRLDVEEAIALSAFARSLKSEYEALGGEAPEWLDNRTRELRREIRARQQDGIEKRLHEAQARLEALKPAAERREELQAEIDKLKASLASVN